MASAGRGLFLAALRPQFVPIGDALRNALFEAAIRGGVEGLRASFPQASNCLRKSLASVIMDHIA
jgi:hypothetical protein